MTDRREQDAEIARLREALEKIATACVSLSVTRMAGGGRNFIDDVVEIARTALEGGTDD